MDQKEANLLNYYYQKFTENNFDEKDVIAFLILIRRHAKGIKSVTELADFIAHRDKDKGGIKDYLADVKYKLDNLGRIDAVLNIKPVFTFNEIRNGINRVLLNNNHQKLKDKTINNIILCVMSLLQDVKLLERDKKKKQEREIGKLKFAISNEKVTLLGEVLIENGTSVPVAAQVPVLEINNYYVNVEKHNEHDTPATLKKTIEIINQNGEFIVTIIE